MENSPQYVIEMLHITKEFPGIKANDDITLQLRKGEIHALLGENGAGKSTLMSVLFGLYQPEEGEILVNGKKAEIKNPRTANALGIGMVHQHFKLIDVLSATENIILGLEGKLDIKEASRKIEEICTKYGFDVDPKQKIYDMSVSQKQTVEIVKVLYRGADILILDEPTRGVDVNAKFEIYTVINELAKEGIAIIMVSSELPEIINMCDNVCVVRAGRLVKKLSKDELSQEEIMKYAAGGIE